MGRIILIILIANTTLLYGQGNFMSVFQALNEKYEIIENIDEIIEVEYSTYSSSSTSPDTVMYIGEEEHSLYISGTTRIAYKSPLERTDTHYKKDGEVSHTTHTKYLKDGSISYQKTDFGGSEAAAMLNSEKVYAFDDEGRLLSVIENGTEMISIEYREGFVIDKLAMNAGIAKLTATSKQVGDTLKYNLEMAMEPEFAAMMGDKKMPKESMDMVIENGLYCYYYYKENEETGLMDFQSLNIYDDDMHQIEEKMVAYNGLNHFKYEYDEQGNLLEKVNQSDDTKLEWTYNSKGQIMVEHVDYSTIYYSYDDLGNVAQKATFQGDSGELISVLIRKLPVESSVSSKNGLIDDK